MSAFLDAGWRRRGLTAGHHAAYNPCMAQAFDVCIRGAGIVGRTLALLLAQQRLRVGLVQATPQADAGNDIRAYALNAASRHILQSLRCWPQGEAVTPVMAMRVKGDDRGEVSFDTHLLGKTGKEPAEEAALAWIVDVPALESCLADALRFQPQIELLEAPHAAALTAICEGRFSRTRAEYGVDFDVTPYGQHAVAARLTCEQAHQGRAWQWFSNGEILAFLPLGGEKGNSVALVWSVSDQRALELCGLSPGAFAAEVQASGASVLGPMTLASERSRWPLQHSQARQWSGRDASGQAWVLAGDAAHAVHPLAGQGLNLGLADAAELAKVLGERDYWRSVGDSRLLRRYERARRAALAPVGAVMDGLQRLFAQPDAQVQTLRNMGMRGFERSGPLKAWVARQAMGLK